MLFVQAASWSHLSELFQAILEHVLKQSLEVILSALWSTEILGNQCKKQQNCLTVLLRCTVTANEDMQPVVTDFDGKKLNF